MSIIDLTVYPERKAIADEPGSLRVALELAANGPKVESDRAPLACVLLLDLSGSMAGPPIEQLVQSVEKLCELAHPTDRLAMVAFSDSASVVAELTAMDAAGRRLFASRARRLIADGGTNIEDALKKGGDLLRAIPGDAQKSLLLLSDGQPNRGASDVHELARVVMSLRPNLSVSTLGYGVRHSDDVLSSIADAGAGKFRFIPNPATCRRDLVAALGAQGDIVAGAIEMLIAPGEGVEIRRFIGDPPVRYGRDGARLSLSDMEDRSQRVVAVELGITRPPRSGELLDVTVGWREAHGGKDEHRTEKIVVDVQSTPAPIDAEACGVILLVRSEEARKEARALADRGQFDGAAAVVRKLLTEIEGAPRYVANDGSPLSEAHELLLDEAVAYERNPSAENYSVFRKQTIMYKLDQDAARSVMPVRGPTSQRFSRITAGLAKPAHLVILSGPDGGRVHRIGDSCAIGRTSGADVVVASANVSRRHAEIYALESDHWICDLGSTNTTEVNGKRLATAPHKLADGDRIRVGDVELRYVLGEPP